MVDVAQLVRASDCGSEGRRFEPGLPPGNRLMAGFFIVSSFPEDSRPSPAGESTCRDSCPGL